MGERINFGEPKPLAQLVEEIAEHFGHGPGDVVGVFDAHDLVMDQRGVKPEQRDARLVIIFRNFRYVDVLLDESAQKHYRHARTEYEGIIARAKR